MSVLSLFIPAAWRLNPYYTGIHLHKPASDGQRRCICLNPYYTGIHLHQIETLFLSFRLSLNPYYTGIHLHFLRENNQIV